MSPDERDAWVDRLAALSWETREPAIYALLDRVEQLERELAAARAKPARIKAVVRDEHGHGHGFESSADATIFYRTVRCPTDLTRKSRACFVDLKSWTYHPATPAKETP